MPPSPRPPPSAQCDSLPRAPPQARSWASTGQSLPRIQEASPRSNLSQHSKQLLSLPPPPSLPPVISPRGRAAGFTNGFSYHSFGAPLEVALPSNHGMAKATLMRTLLPEREKRDKMKIERRKRTVAECEARRRLPAERKRERARRKQLELVEQRQRKGAARCMQRNWRDGRDSRAARQAEREQRAAMRMQRQVRQKFVCQQFRAAVSS